MAKWTWKSDEVCMAEQDVDVNKWSSKLERIRRAWRKEWNLVYEKRTSVFCPWIPPCPSTERCFGLFFAQCPILYINFMCKAWTHFLTTHLTYLAWCINMIQSTVSRTGSQSTLSTQARKLTILISMDCRVHLEEKCLSFLLDPDA